jgi:hypothetical protein
MDKVLKFNEYSDINEATYVMQEDGTMKMKEFEMVKDHHPNKFAHLGENFLTSEFAWVIRKNENIISVMSGDISPEIMYTFFKMLEKNT